MDAIPAVLQSLLPALASTLVIAFAGWLASLLFGKVSIVDSLWPLFIVTAGLQYGTETGFDTERSKLVAALLLAWGARLFLHIALRNLGEPEDRRYGAMREKHERFALKSLYIVFGFQAVLAWIVSWPIAAVSAAGQGIGALDALAVALWCLGMLFEVVSDWQLARFRRDPKNRTRVLDSGLWRYTRHPNYFGEFCIWWSFYLFALAAGGWWTIVSPVLMSVLLLRVSGVPLLERSLGDRRPAYREYVQRTNAFFPWLPHKRPAARL